MPGSPIPRDITTERRAEFLVSMRFLRFGMDFVSVFSSFNPTNPYCWPPGRREMASVEPWDGAITHEAALESCECRVLPASLLMGGGQDLAQRGLPITWQRDKSWARAGQIL